MTIEQGANLLVRLENLKLAKAKGSDTGKLNRFKRSLKWALEEETDEAKVTALDKLEFNFISQESLDLLTDNEQDKESLAPYLVEIAE